MHRLLIGGIIALSVLIPTVTQAAGLSKEDIVHAEEFCRREAGSKPHLIVRIEWPNDLSVDVDLWVNEPGGVTVKFSRHTGSIFHLLSDAQPAAGLVPHNVELAVTCGMKIYLREGSYVISAHRYWRGGSAPAVDVDLTIWITYDGLRYAHVDTKSVRLDDFSPVKEIGRLVVRFK